MHTCTVALSNFPVWGIAPNLCISFITLESPSSEYKAADVSLSGARYP